MSRIIPRVTEEQMQQHREAIADRGAYIVFPRAALESLCAEVELLRTGLEESVKLQSHYAVLLNQWDEGHRRQFPTGEAWLQRLFELRQAAEPTHG
jgi:hypothetical protein